MLTPTTAFSGWLFSETALTLKSIFAPWLFASRLKIMPALPKSSPVRLPLFKLAFFRFALLKLPSGHCLVYSNCLTWFCWIEAGIYLAAVYITAIDTAAAVSNFLNFIITCESFRSFVLRLMYYYIRAIALCWISTTICPDCGIYFDPPRCSLHIYLRADFKKILFISLEGGNLNKIWRWLNRNAIVPALL